jgi:hypothetical protein
MQYEISIPDIYNSPTNDDTCVVMCFFNPAGYKQTVKNTNHVVSQIKKSNIPLFLTELVYKDEKPQIKDTNFTVYSNSKIFSKENLWNITARRLPDKYKKIIFLDSDIKFADKDWFNKSSIILNQHPVMQPMSYVYRKIYLNTKNKTIDTSDIYHSIWFKQSIANYIVKHKKINQRYCHSGYCIGLQRKFFEKINGFFELAIVGGGDALFWYSFLEKDLPISYTITEQTYLYKKYHEHKKRFREYLNIEDVSYLKNSLAFHLYHGTLNNRKYIDRNKILDQFNVQTNFYHNSQGVLEINSDLLQNSINKYFYDRKEDD